MTKQIGILSSAASLAIFIAFEAKAVERDGSQTKANASGFAVVELFTSQGCSSCPPADAALARVHQVAQEKNLEVLCLSFHVDYWNRLGWTDPYSHPEHSERQRSYASASGSSRVYTPQMVVNGKTEFVGSDTRKASSAIRSALKQLPGSAIELASTSPRDSRVVNINYRTSGTGEHDVIRIALVSRPPANKVDRGENAGRTLRHVNVVRELKTIPLMEKAGRVQFKLPPELAGKDAAVIAFVQHAETMEITGAANLEFAE